LADLLYRPIEKSLYVGRHLGVRLVEQPLPVGLAREEFALNPDWPASIAARSVSEILGRRLIAALPKGVEMRVRRRGGMRKVRRMRRVREIREVGR
jgi:hypothetical protein